MDKVDEASNRQGTDDFPTIKMYQDIVDRAHSEVESVRKVYYWLSGIIGIILSVGIGSLAFVTYKSFHEMRADMKDEVEFMKRKASQDYTTLATDLKSSVEKKVLDVETKVNTRIDAEFNRDNIQGLVRDKAQERIDKVADIIIGRQIEKRITPKIDVVDNRIKELTTSMEFTSVLSAANNDDRNAFEQLRIWSKDKSYPLRSKAEQSFRRILSEAQAGHLVSEHPYPWKTGTDPSKLSMTELRTEFRSVVLTIDKKALMEYLAERTDITKKDKLSFLIDVLKTDQSLEVAEKAADLFNRLSGQQFDTMNTKLILEWYDKHSRGIE